MTPKQRDVVALTKASHTGNNLIHVGSRGDAVKRIQRTLGLVADGVFGKNTEAAVKKWQADQGLTAEGVVGPKTLAKMES
jgi:peptidoglycan hydrolase-like protein with peptidoglycan-binding domain